jgi:hypothetical protein
MGLSGSKPTCPPSSINSINHDKMLQNIDHMFRSVNATQVTDLPLTDAYSATSDIDVSTIRPMAGGATFSYTRNRYQVYENKLHAAAMKGGDGNEPAGTRATLEAVEAEKTEETEETEVRVEAEAEETAEEKMLKKKRMGETVLAALGEVGEAEAVDMMDRPKAIGARPAEGYDIGRQMGGMTVDREIENIRSFLLNTNAQRGGGNMDNDMDLNLRMVRDNLLNQAGGNMVFSATSENPVDYNLVMQNGGAAFSATSDNPIDYNVIAQAGGSLPFSATSENPVDYNMLMRGGAKVDSDQSGGDIISDPSDSDTESDSDLTEDSESESSGSASDSDISGAGIDITDIMRLQRGIDKRQNRSNFLRGDYVLTSNSDQNYKISGRPYFSSQSSEYQNEVASEFLNTLRSRNRS